MTSVQFYSVERFVLLWLKFFSGEDMIYISLGSTASYCANMVSLPDHCIMTCSSLRRNEASSKHMFQSFAPSSHNQGSLDSSDGQLSGPNVSSHLPGELFASPSLIINISPKDFLQFVYCERFCPGGEDKVS